MAEMEAAKPKIGKSAKARSDPKAQIPDPAG
jgi:hypothetical protein